MKQLTSLSLADTTPARPRSAPLSGRRTTSRLPRIAALSVACALAVVLAACGGGGAPKAGSAPQACGMGRTAANVPVQIEVSHGQVACGVARTVMKSYAAAIVAGQAPGNGGGGPITVNGWKCQGFPTPEELKSGDVSRCDKDSAEILAVLTTPSS